MPIQGYVNFITKKNKIKFVQDGFGFVTPRYISKIMLCFCEGKTYEKQKFHNKRLSILEYRDYSG